MRCCSGKRLLCISAISLAGVESIAIGLLAGLFGMAAFYKPFWNINYRLALGLMCTFISLAVVLPCIIYAAASSRDLAGVSSDERGYERREPASRARYHAVVCVSRLIGAASGFFTVVSYCGLKPLVPGLKAFYLSPRVSLSVLPISISVALICMIVPQIVVALSSCNPEQVELVTEDVAISSILSSPCAVVLGVLIATSAKASGYKDHFGDSLSLI